MAIELLQFGLEIYSGVVGVGYYVMRGKIIIYHKRDSITKSGACLLDASARVITADVRVITADVRVITADVRVITADVRVWLRPVGFSLYLLFEKYQIFFWVELRMSVVSQDSEAGAKCRIGNNSHHHHISLFLIWCNV